MNLESVQSSTIARHFSAVLAKRTGLTVCVTGEAGIGKSFQVSRALAELECPSASLHAAASQAQFMLVLPAVKKIPDWAQQTISKLERSEFVATQAFINSLIAVLRALAPFVLHLEDVHEASPERRELIEILGRAVRGTKGLGLLVTSRHGVPNGFSSLEVAALTPAESAVLLERELEAVLPSEALGYVFERARGNPLFTLEFLKYLTRQGYLWSDGSRWSWRIPPEGLVPFTIEALIENMISSLVSPDARNVLEARAMMPAQIAASPEVLSSLSRVALGALTNILETLERDGILRHQDFAHPLIREVILHNLGAERRRELARIVLNDLENTNLELAARFVKDAQLSPELAYGVLEKAAIHARNQHDMQLEAHWLVEALDCAPVELRSDLAIRAAEAIKRFDLPQAIRVANIAVQHSPQNAKAVFTLARCMATVGQGLEAEQLILTLSQETRDSTDSLEQHLLVRAHADETAGAFEIWQRLEARGATSNPQIVNQAVQTLYLHGDTERAVALADRAFNELDINVLQRAMLLIDFRARYFFELGDYLEAERQISDAVELLRHQSDPRVLALAIGNRGIVRGSLNRMLEAIEDFKEAAKLFANVGLTLKYAECLDCLGTTYGNLGRFVEAELVLLEAREILRQSQLIKDLASCESSLATLYANWMPPHGKSLILKHARAALEAAREVQIPALYARYLKTVSLAEAGHGDPKKALLHAEQLMAMSKSVDNPRVTKQALHAYGIALDVNDQAQKAVMVLREAIELERDSGALEITDTLELEIDRITHNSEAAREKIKRFEETGEHMLLTLARRYFPELAQEKAPDFSPPNSSSPVELLVLGEVLVHKHDQPIKYRGRKRLEFLLYLLETRISGRDEASTLELIDALYPALAEAEAKASLKQLVYLLRNQLGSHSIQSTPNGYALGAVKSDIEAFLNTPQAQLWRGTYLQGFGEGWIQSVRDAAVHALQQKVEQLAETEPKQAVRLGKILLEMEPYDLDVLELTLQALIGSHENPNRFYLERRQQLLEVNQILPETASAFLKERQQSLARV
jgi:tetratricopeptide (TPR) repeat protein